MRVENEHCPIGALLVEKQKNTGRENRGREREERKRKRKERKKNKI